MSQYFIIVNLEKREYIHPHDINRGAKLLEVKNDELIGSLISFLLDHKKEENNNYLYLSRWIENKVILIGDSEDYSLFKQVITDFNNISKNAYNEYLNFYKKIH